VLLFRDKFYKGELNSNLMKTEFKSIGYINSNDKLDLEKFIYSSDSVANETKDRLRNTYFYDKKRNTVRNREDDRNDFILALCDKDIAISRSTANYIVENLKEYSKSKRTLSQEGINTLSKHWEKIEENISKYDSSIGIAKEYLLKQNSINEKRELDKKGEDDRNAAVGRLNDSDSFVSGDTADSIIKNLGEYSDSGKNLSRKGCIALTSNWEKIQDNTHMDNSFIKAENYLKSQMQMLNSNQKAKSSAHDNKTNHPQKLKEKSGLLEKIVSGTTSKISGFISRFPYRLVRANA